MNAFTLVQNLWNYCNVLRDDGMSYGDYSRLHGDRLEQLTYLMFFKMAVERSRPPLSGQMSQPSPIPVQYAWPALLTRDGDELVDHYRHTLEELGKSVGTLALIFAKAQNKFQDPIKLRRVIVDLIDEEDWSSMGADVKGSIVNAGLEPDNLPVSDKTKLDFGRSSAIAKAKAWRDIRGAGQGVGQIDETLPAAANVERLEAEYFAVCRRVGVV